MSRLSGCGMLFAIVCIAGSGPLFAGGEEMKLHGNVVLALDRGIPGGRNGWAELELEFPVREGKWPECGWGYATWFQRGHHAPRIVSNEVVNGVRMLCVDMAVGPDNWAPGGRAWYNIELKPAGEGWTGSFKGSFRKGGPLLGGPERAIPAALRANGADVVAAGGVEDSAPAVALEGTVRGRLDPVWPGVLAGHARPEPGEHPRLAFRKSLIPELRRRASETPEGKAMLERAMAVANEAPVEGDKFSTWPAVGHGFLYVMTGDRAHAGTARRIVEETLLHNPNGRAGQSVTQDIHHGPRLLGLALAYDLCHDAWDEAFRLKCVDEIQLRAWEVRLGEFEGKIMSGYNPNPWSNHNAIRVSCAGMGALAVLGEKNSAGRVMEDAEAIADIMAWEAREHFRTGLGGSGWCMEGGYYKVMTMDRGFAYFTHAYENVLGRKIDAGLIGDFDMVGYFMEASPGTLTPSLADVVWSVDMLTAPEDMLPGVKWIFDRAVGLKGSKTFGIQCGMMAPFIMARYPYDLQEKHPGECFRWMAPDPRKGHWVFRPTWRDKDDILLTLNLKSEIITGSWASSRAGDCVSEIQLDGFGRKWLSGQYLVTVYGAPLGNKHHGALLTSWKETPDRTVVMNMNMDRAYYEEASATETDMAEYVKRKGALAIVDLPYWGKFLDYGIRATRSMAVDCSGKSGSPLLVAMVDIVTPPAKGAGADAGKREKDGSGASGAVVPAKRKSLTEEEQKAALRDLLFKEKGIRVEGRAESTYVSKEGVSLRWALPLPLNRSPGLVGTDGGAFTVGDSKGGPCLAGVVCAPAKLHPDRVAADGEEAFFSVLSLQNGSAPKFVVQGDGLKSVVRVGNRLIRYEGGSIVLEDAKRN